MLPLKMITPQNISINTDIVLAHRSLKLKEFTEAFEEFYITS